jgi:hypothetical protein
LSPAEAICFWHLTGAHAYPPVTAVGFYAGFFIGEGSFGHEWSEGHQYLSFSVKLTINYDRINILLGFKSFCANRGHLYVGGGLKQNKKTIDWICTKNEELLYKVIPALDKLPLVGLKKEHGKVIFCLLLSIAEVEQAKTPMIGVW